MRIVNILAMAFLTLENVWRKHFNKEGLHQEVLKQSVANYITLQRRE